MPKYRKDESEDLDRSDITSASMIEKRRKYYNPEIHQQLVTFMGDIEKKFKRSVMNRDYRFPKKETRPNSLATEGRRGLILK